jgi:sugar/nucleoside kinase (ribokinase family)
MAAVIEDVVCAGILVADTFCGPMQRLPDPGELMSVRPFTSRSGGCAANAAICLAKQGVACRVAGTVGSDAAGQLIIQDLESRGCDVSCVVQSATTPTSQTVILLCTGQDRRFVHSFGANTEFAAEDIAKAITPRTKILYVGGFLAMPNLQGDALAEVLFQAKRQGTTTLLDVVVAADQRGFEPLWRVLPAVDVFLPNEDEARQCTGRDDPLEQARVMRDHGAGIVVLTMGPSGALVVGPEGPWRVSSLPVKAVDPSGGGDAFAAGVIKGLREGWDIKRAVQLGAILGASCVEVVGCHDGVVDEQTALTTLETSAPTIRAI